MKTTKQIVYKKGYKYQLVEEYSAYVQVLPVEDIETDYISLTKEGVLSLSKMYAWDGATGIIDTDSIMRGSLEHDALYQLMRMGLLSGKVYRIWADKQLRLTCKEDGMPSILAQCAYQGVRVFGEVHSIPANAKIVYKAPE